jgi:hypothetical protein
MIMHLPAKSQMVPEPEDARTYDDEIEAPAIRTGELAR